MSLKWGWSLTKKCVLLYSGNWNLDRPCTRFFILAEEHCFVICFCLVNYIFGANHTFHSKKGKGGCLVFIRWDNQNERWGQPSSKTCFCSLWIAPRYFSFNDLWLASFNLIFRGPWIGYFWASCTSVWRSRWSLFQIFKTLFQVNVVCRSDLTNVEWQLQNSARKFLLRRPQVKLPIASSWTTWEEDNILRLGPVIKLV
jgi:hypothetical protein